MKQALKNLIYTIFRPTLMQRGDAGAIYLTYDDGPHPDNTMKILASLDRYNVKATFFMIGINMEKHPDIVQMIVTGGHTLGYHSYRHKSLKKMSLREIREDFAKIQKLSSQFNYQITLYRPPFGDLSLKAFLYLLFSPWKIVMWTLDCRDSFDAPDEVIDNIRPEKISDGEVILLHDDYEHAEQIIENALREYQINSVRCRAL